MAGEYENIHINDLKMLSDGNSRIVEGMVIRRNDNEHKKENS